MYSSVSDGLLVVTVLGYLVAMVGFAVEYAFGRQGAVARVAARTPDRERVLVGPGGEEIVDAEPPAEDAPAPPIGSGRAALIGKIALVVQTLACLAHAGCLLCRGLAAQRVPWGNMYEYVLMACLVATVAWLIAAYRRPTIRHLGVFVSLIVAILLCIDASKLYATAGPLEPALNSYWLWIHVTAMTVASGVFLVGFIAAALYLVQERREAWLRVGRPLRFPLSLGERLPKAAVLERLTFRVHTLAFPVWTFGIMCGAIWAEHAWGTYWGWDPKETWSFIAWVIYAAYLHARATPSIRGRWSSWIAVVGWATMMVNLFAVNLVVSGLHSYAGVG